MVLIVEAMSVPTWLSLSCVYLFRALLPALVQLVLCCESALVCTACFVVNLVIMLCLIIMQPLEQSVVAIRCCHRILISVAAKATNACNIV